MGVMLIVDGAASVLRVILTEIPIRIAEDGGIGAGVSAADLWTCSPVISDRSDRTRRATSGGAIAGGVGDPFLLNVPTTLIVCKNHCTDVGAPKCVGGVR